MKRESTTFGIVSLSKTYGIFSRLTINERTQICWMLSVLMIRKIKTELFPNSWQWTMTIAFDYIEWQNEFSWFVLMIKINQIIEVEYCNIRSTGHWLLHRNKFDNFKTTSFPNKIVWIFINIFWIGLFPLSIVHLFKSNKSEFLIFHFRCWNIVIRRSIVISC